MVSLCGSVTCTGTTSSHMCDYVALGVAAR